MNEKLCGSNNLYVKPAEVCAFKALSLLNYNLDKNNIFDSSFTTTYSDINSQFRDSIKNNEYNYKYNNNNKKDLCNPLRPEDKDSPYAVNCVIATGNPFFTYDKKTKTCKPLPGLELPQGFEYQVENGETYVYYDKNKSLDKEGKYSYKFKKPNAYCENKWYDWITIPNYHFGNYYQKDSGMYSQEDVWRCYKPCKIGFMPYIDINGSNICIEKSEADDGIYSKTIDYSPIALINLIGNNEKTITNLYYLMYLNEIEKINKDNTIGITYTIQPEYDLKTWTRINNTNYTNEIREAINEIKTTLWDNIIKDDSFDAPGAYTNKQIFTYKHPYFNGDDPNLMILKSLSNNGVVSNDAILIHTFIMAAGFYEFINDKVFTLIKNNPAYDKYTNNNPFNIKKTLEILLREQFEKKGIISNENRKNKYKERLANILYKSINICYNGKTDFSKNLLRFTKTAFENYKYDQPTVSSTDKNYYFNSFVNYKFPRGSDDSIIYNDAFTYATINNYYSSYLKELNGFEITYYENEDFTNRENFLKMIADQTDGSGIIISDSTQQQKQKENMADNIIKTFLFFTLETNEKKSNNKCKVGEIYDLENKRCKICKEFCNKESNKCKTDNRCNIYCEDTCSSYDVKIKSKCGTSPEKHDEITEKIKAESQIEIDEIGVSISSIQDTMKTGIRIFFLLLSLYLLYIFYKIFGESIAVIANFFLYYIHYIWVYITTLSDWNKYVIKRDMAEYVKDVEVDRYEKVYEKASTVKKDE